MESKLGIALLSVIGSLALAQQGPPSLTTAQQDCLESHGVSMPILPSQSTIEAAMQACGVDEGTRPTTTQQTCLEDNGLTLPTPNSNPSGMQSAFQACGISMPQGGPHFGNPPGSTHPGSGTTQEAEHFERKQLGSEETGHSEREELGVVR